MKRLALRILIVLSLLALAGFGIWLLTLPAAPAEAAAPPIARAEHDALIGALRPPRPRRPVIAVIGINAGTETTDYLMPYGILQRADVADVTLLATGPGPVSLFPALTVMPQATTADFDARHPEGADYVIVPRLLHDDDPAALAWIRAQTARGAIVIGVCAGAKVVAAAGLLDGRRATTHWYYLDEMLERHPSIVYARDRRFVVDGRVATTTGITASMPMMLTLIEAIAGRARAAQVAQGLGVDRWDARHASAAFRFNRPFALTVTANILAFWNRERLGLEITPGIDEVSLALVADAWSRTYRSQVQTFAAGGGVGISRNGLRLIPDQIAGSWPDETRLPPIAARPPARALDDALTAIEARYGRGTANVVAQQLEYPR